MFEIKKYKGGFCLKSDRLNKYVYGVGMKIRKITQYKNLFIIYHEDYTYQLLNSFLEPVYGEEKFRFIGVLNDLIILTTKEGHFLLSPNSLKQILGEGKRFYRIQYMENDLFEITEDTGSYVLDVKNLKEVLGKEERFFRCTVTEKHIVAAYDNPERNNEWRFYDKKTYKFTEKTITSYNFTQTHCKDYLLCDVGGYYLVDPETLEELMDGERYEDIISCNYRENSYLLKEEKDFNYIYYRDTKKYEYRNY